MAVVIVTGKELGHYLVTVGQCATFHVYMLGCYKPVKRLRFSRVPLENKNHSFQVGAKTVMKSGRQSSQVETV